MQKCIYVCMYICICVICICVDTYVCMFAHPSLRVPCVLEYICVLFIALCLYAPTFRGQYYHFNSLTNFLGGAGAPSNEGIAPENQFRP